MQLVEQHVIKQTDSRYQAIDQAAFASKNLYNAANYEIRQAFIFQGISLNYEEMDKRMKSHEAYKALPAKVAQQVLKLLDKNWKAFRKGLAAWHQDPSSLLGRPALPKYKDKLKGRNILIYTIQALSKKALKRGLICPSMLPIEVETRQSAIDQVRIIPNWKQECEMRKKDKQHFVQIPHARFVNMLCYKAKLVGIQVILQEESYTSKASFLESDPLPTYGKVKSEPPFSGRRVKRGLYKAGNGKQFNADVNASYNILRKASPDALAQGSRGWVVHPVRLHVQTVYSWL